MVINRLDKVIGIFFISVSLTQDIFVHIVTRFILLFDIFDHCPNEIGSSISRLTARLWISQQLVSHLCTENSHQLQIVISAVSIRIKFLMKLILHR